MLIRKILCALTLGLMLSITPAQAHHSFSATFTEEIITVEGFVDRVSFSNPHIIVYFNVPSRGGEQTEWMIEGGAATLMRNRGWSRDSLVEGDFIRVTGNSTRNGSPMVSLGTLNLIDPVTKAVLGEPGGEIADPVSPEELLLPLVRADGLPNLTGAWTNAIRGGGPPGSPEGPRGSGGPPGGGPGRGGPAMPFNEVGAALQAEYDPVNDPQVQCEPPGVVRQAGFTPHPVRVEQFDDHVVISYEEYGGVRTVYFDDRDLVGGAHSNLGQSIARYEGQNLIIETSHLLANLTGPNGNGITDQTTTVETFFRSEDEDGRSFLNLEMAVTDPGHLSGVWNLSWKKPFTPDYEFIEVDCHKPLAY